MAVVWWLLHLLYVAFLETLISVVCEQISRDFFSLKKIIGKNKGNALEMPILSWGQTKGPWYANVSQREGNTELSDAFCLVSQTLYHSPCQSQGEGEKPLGISSPYTI